jgi:hypothetical protein
LDCRSTKQSLLSMIDDFFASNIAVEPENFPKVKSLNFEDRKRYQI